MVSNPSSANVCWLIQLVLEHSRNQSPPKRPTRKRCATKKLIEDSTRDIPSTPRHDSLQQQQDPMALELEQPVVPTDDPVVAHHASEAVASPPLPVGPLRDEGANPFLTSVYPPLPPPTRNLVAPSTEERYFALTPSTPSRSPDSERARQESLRRSIVYRRHRHEVLENGPSGNQHRHSAKDVWTFFEVYDQDNSKNNCLFCK